MHEMKEIFDCAPGPRDRLLHCTFLALRDRSYPATVILLMSTMFTCSKRLCAGEGLARDTITQAIFAVLIGWIYDGQVEAWG